MNTTSRKIILNLAISLDGYIARDDGSYDWMVGDNDPMIDLHLEEYYVNEGIVTSRYTRRR